MADAPLAGRRIVVTRPREQAESLAAALRERGAEVVLVPLIEIARDTTDRKRAIRDLGRYDWLVFTSANGVATFSRIPRAEWLLRNVRIAVVGPATAAAVRKLGAEPAYVPERFAADEIAAGLGELGGTRFLLVQSDIASESLAKELRTRGAYVQVVRTYRTVGMEPPTDELAELRAADAVVLASGSAARSLASQGGAGGALVVCIGPKTADVAREVGLEVGLVAREATSEGIIHALTSHFGENE